MCHSVCEYLSKLFLKVELRRKEFGLAFSIYGNNIFLLLILTLVGIGRISYSANYFSNFAC